MRGQGREGMKRQKSTPASRNSGVARSSRPGPEVNAAAVTAASEENVRDALVCHGARVQDLSDSGARVADGGAPAREPEGERQTSPK
ncbi:hypothetical protein GCM10010344_03140 [Streptomyces bluensis]|nr:hypothetical protein GCM10010344_03140 [Streptomyces bluensis]